MPGFVYKGDLLGTNQSRALRRYTITDSTALTVGEAVQLTSGKLVVAGAGAMFLGILCGFEKADGAPVTDNGAGGDFTDTYTTPTSNTVVGIVDISKTSLYSVTFDGTIGTTTGSDLPGYYADLVAASNQLDETDTDVTTAQFALHGTDPDDDAPSNSVLCSIFESQIFGPLET